MVLLKFESPSDLFLGKKFDSDKKQQEIPRFQYLNLNLTWTHICALVCECVLCPGLWFDLWSSPQPHLQYLFVEMWRLLAVLAGFCAHVGVRSGVFMCVCLHLSFWDLMWNFERQPLLFFFFFVEERRSDEG